MHTNNNSPSRYPFTLDFSILVVAADSGVGLKECIRRLMATSLSMEVILVDNASRDGIVPAIDRAYAHDARCKVIYSRENLGFGPAMNLAAGQARGRALVMLNPDCLVQQADLLQLLQALDEWPGAGLVGAVVCDADGRPDPASWRRDPLFRRALNSVLGRRENGVNIERTLPDGVVEAEAVSGALMLMPRELFGRLGGFDEAFFLHCEDLDLCRRVRDFGRKVLLAGNVRVHHAKGSSSHHRPVFVSRYKHRGMWRWFRKHDPASRNRWIRMIVWTGIWSHFLLKVPGQLLRLSGAKKGNGERGTRNR